ncbi:MAG: alkaline phosphatase D family protein [Actinomycetota bacterium]
MTHDTTLGRRSFLAGVGAATGALVLPTVLTATSTAAAAPTGAVVDPFTLGVASGDPLPQKVVIWTRLAPRPLQLDGGMPNRPVTVRWEVAKDEGFRNVVARGAQEALPRFGHSVHVDVGGLRPHTYYWYRFRVRDQISPVGRTRTAPAILSSPTVTLAFASCSQYEHGYFTAYRRLAEDNPDIVFHLGDYIYEYGPGGFDSPTGNVRSHEGPEIRSLGDYRRRYAQYRTDPDLQLAHATAPFVVTWDDHEIDNNHAGNIPEDRDPAEGNDTPENFALRRAAAYQAYWENMPFRPKRRPRFRRPTEFDLYRRFEYGRTASFHVLDERQYRTDQPCNDEFANACGEENDPDATILGDEQATWLEDGLVGSQAAWQVVPQQIFMSNLDGQPGEGNAGYTDGWDGYRASRQRLLGFVRDQRVENFVVLTGDVHSNWLSDLRFDFEDETSPVLGTEFVGTSITSGGDGSDQSSFFPFLQPENPHLRYNNNRRGYVRCTVDANEFRADYRVVDVVSQPGAQVRTDKSFVVESGNPVANDA